jgi:hypothetical protein
MLSRLLRMSLHRRGTVAELQRQRKVDGMVNIIGGSMACASHWHVQATGRITVPIGITYHRGKNRSGAVAVG